MKTTDGASSRVHLFFLFFFFYTKRLFTLYIKSHLYCKKFFFLALISIALQYLSSYASICKLIFFFPFVFLSLVFYLLFLSFLSCRLASLYCFYLLNFLGGVCKDVYLLVCFFFFIFFISLCGDNRTRLSLTEGRFLSFLSSVMVASRVREIAHTYRVDLVVKLMTFILGHSMFSHFVLRNRCFSGSEFTVTLLSS